MTDTKPQPDKYGPHPHPPYIRWIVFSAALLPFIVTMAYMYLEPVPKMLKRNFPPAQTSEAAPPNTGQLAPTPTPR